MKRTTQKIPTGRTNLPYGSFVVFGSMRAPQCILLDGHALRIYADRSRVADASKAITATFGTGAEYALPAHSVECMELIALQYIGPYQREVRGMCALIALGEPFNPDEGGGTSIEPKRQKPKPRGPSSTRLEVNKSISIS